MCDKPWCTCEDTEFYILRMEELEADLVQAKAERDAAYKALVDEKAKKAKGGVV